MAEFTYLNEYHAAVENHFIQYEPLEDEIKMANDITYVFVVDRSQSMSGIKMEITKEALQLFLQSLPYGCYF